jgi:RNA polymerase sigma factor (sigma-70 family)
MAKHFGNTQQIENLLARIQAGDEKAREELIKESQERLRLLASKMLKGFPGVARLGGQTGDVLQPVLFRLYCALEKKKFDSGRAFVAYAATMIRNELLGLARKYRQERAARITDRPNAIGQSPLDRVGKRDPEPGVPPQAEKWDRFHEAVEQLPDDQKQVVELRCYGQWSRQETAVILDVDEKTVTRRYGRAMENLGVALQGVFGDGGR